MTEGCENFSFNIFDFPTYMRVVYGTGTWEGKLYYKALPTLPFWYVSIYVYLYGYVLGM